MDKNKFNQMPFWKEYPERDTEFIRVYPPANTKISEQDIWAKKDMGFYVHIPFCKNVCMSCPYHKMRPEKELINIYIDALKKEITNYGARDYVKDHKFTAGYIGGGTPTTLTSSQLDSLLKHIRTSFDLSKEIEITVETTPLDIDKEKLDVLCSNGVDRISLGVQSFISAELADIGRNYNIESVHKVISMIKEAGIKKLNIDLMYGLPGQTMDTWEKTIDAAINAGATGISMYNFMLLENPANVIKQIKKKLAPMPDNNTRDKQFYFAADKLTKAGYNGLFGDEFSKPGFKNAYVTKPWEECLDFVGVGTWAMGNIKNHWYFNQTDINKYIKTVESGALPLQIGSEITPADQLRRRMILGVKTGMVSRKGYKAAMGIDFAWLFKDIIEDLEKKGLVKLDDEALKVAGPNGWFYMDNISKAFFRQDLKRYPQPVQNENISYY